MEAFIVRPFGIKEGINFDEVQERLILPALEKAKIKGYTTGVILEAGNIRQDMFQLLLTSEVVVADISIHNANVFYELGIRHALREKKTILIRCRKDEVPFDLKTDRYIAYEQDNLESSVEVLAEALKQTLISNRTDSPVFLMLPKLTAQNPEHFLAVPLDYRKEVFLAKETGHRGKLSLLAAEAKFFSWQIPALRMVGDIQYRSKYYTEAKEVWEHIRKNNPNDLEANEYLATIYHRLGDIEVKQNSDIAHQLLAKSELAINRLFDQFSILNRNKRAEAYALRARNEKTKWVRRWIMLKPEEMGKKAIRSSSLLKAYKNYSKGYDEDLNHFYSGVNALGLLKTLIALAQREVAIWESKFDTALDAKIALDRYVEEFDQLVITVKRAAFSAKKALERDNLTDPWVLITLADLAVLTINNPERVKHLYCSAIESGSDLNFDAAKRQLVLFQKLNIMSKNVTPALEVFGNSDESSNKVKKVLLFTGHMIDGEDRKTPRFPKELEPEVRRRIKEGITEIVNKSPSEQEWIGISGGASGGDILFLEICKELGVQRKMYLALPPEKYIVESVQFAGSSWVDRFYALYEDADTEVSILAESKELPVWLYGKKGYTFWERNNLWLLNTALSYGDRNLTLLALWDGKGEDGPGGTKHMLEEVKKKGAKTKIIQL
ncbi:tetratricopeptide repeat-containing protein [Arenibacter lacus]|uniref:tetratricopeptide repeat-containing protein n=1 Tax=Arenibacter lacus TaxID=2608629 RepID=UPI00123D739B|nr:tetratricopeptide repeat-containing protein [Arenibacter lacus]